MGVGISRKTLSFGSNFNVTVVPFPTAPLEIMRHACGPAVDELVLSGRLLDAVAAQRCGLVHEVVDADALLGEAIRRAQWLARVPAGNDRPTASATSAELRA